MGDRPCEMELLSDPSVNFPSKFGTVNYEDPNYNIAMPIFVIHGNHDDPSGDGNLSPIDILSTAGLVNYFGKTASVDDISIVPILLKKGENRLALYGLGGIRDERLHRTFLQKKVKMLRPIEEESWFNMLILHQNRVPHGPTNYIPETFLDDFLDLVVWGHEHESMACDPTECTQRGFMVCQPGSSVATSLCEGEAKRKHVVILKITGSTFETVPIPLKSVRPFVVKDVALRNASPKIDSLDSQAINNYLCTEVDSLIEEAHDEWNERNPEIEFPLPLVRLRVDCTLPIDQEAGKPYAVINPQRFGQQFISKVANPRDIIHYLKRRGGPNSLAAQRRQQKNIEIPEDATTDPNDNLRVEDLVSQYLGCQKLDVFPQNEFGDILRTSIEKTDNGLIEKFISESIGRVIRSTSGQEMIVSHNKMDLTALKTEFERVKRLREEEWNRLHPTIYSVLMNVGEAPASARNSVDEDSDGQDGRVTSTRGRGRGRGGSLTRGASTSGLGRGAKVTTSTAASKRSILDLVLDNEIEGDGENDAEEVLPTTSKRQLSLAPASSPQSTTRSKATVKATTAWPPRRK